MLNVVILAAGQGKRMQSDLPKVLHSIAGQPMLTHVLQTAYRLKPDRIMVVVGHGEAEIRSRFADDVGIIFVQQRQQLGTGHAVQQALASPEAALSDESTTLVLYGDVPLIQADTLRNLLDKRGTGVALLSQQLDNPSGYGRIVRDAKGQVSGIVEEKDASEAQRQITEVNTGILAAPTGQLKQWLDALDNNNAQGEYYLTDVIAKAVSDGLTVSSSEAKFAWETAGVNNRRQQAWLERQWQQQLANQLLDNGVALADPSRIDIRGNLSCGRDVFIDVGCVFEGDVHLGDGARVGPHCVVKNSRIAEGAIIHAFTHIQEASVGPQAQIGPYARLRPQANIGAYAQIGNFVEVKNTQLGAHSKASHLSYLGDAAIGEQVNIGAGTITCNYDGANKHQTIIEDDVFIGSSTQLVAPVTVGRGATVGAGTTLVKDAPAGQLTLSRAEQQTIRHWARPTKKS